MQKHPIFHAQDAGFTLIEMLAVIVILGILAAIALPSFLNQANRARESEAATYIGSINRAQQAHFVEKLIFASSWDGIELGVATETANYNYIEPAADPGFRDAVIATADPINSGFIRRYEGRVWAIDPTDERTTRAMLCRSVTAGEQMAIGATSGQISCDGVVGGESP